MQGIVSIKKYHSGSYTDEDFTKAAAAGKLEDLLGALEKRFESGGHNQILHGYVGGLFDGTGASGIAMFLSAPAPANEALIRNGIAFCILASTSTEPAYTESQSRADYPWAMTDIVSTTAYKLFIEQQIVAHSITKDVNGKQSATFRSKWLFLPSEATSTSIRSLVIYSSNDADGTGSTLTTRMARWRIRDNGGNPTTLSKAADEILHIQYDLVFTSH